MKFKIILFALLLLLILSLTACTKKPVCGNGIVEEGETTQTCCQDTGCFGQQTCQNNQCTDPICDECQYLEDHICKDYECCKNTDCQVNEICQDNKCVRLNCGFCEYIFEHACLKATCCNDADCSDGNINTEDTCLNPGEKDANCVNKIGQCSDGTLFNECNDNGERCVAPGNLGLGTSCESYKPPCFQEDKRVAIVEFVAPNIEKWNSWGGYDYIELLNNDKPFIHFEEPSPSRDIFSINYIPQWYNRESKKYGQNIDLNINIFGPYYLTEFPPLQPYKREQQVYLDRNFLQNYVEDKGVDLEDYDAWIPLYLYNYYKLDEEEGTALHPNSEAISFQIDSEPYPFPQRIVTIAHEIAHLFCATDKYIRYTCKHPDGVPDPDSYPQSKACLMCDKRVIEKEGPSLTIDSMEQVVLCEKTAEEFGWID